MVDLKQNPAAQLPRINVAIPASIYVNGRQIPPIESQGTIFRFGCNSLHICCDRPVPIPSKGILRFAFERGNGGEFELDVEFKSCFQRSGGFWSWGKKSEYEMQITITDTSMETTKRYQHYVNQMIFGNKPANVTLQDDHETRYSD